MPPRMCKNSAITSSIKSPIISLASDALMVITSHFFHLHAQHFSYYFIKVEASDQINDRHSGAWETMSAEAQYVRMSVIYHTIYIFRVTGQTKRQAKGHSELDSQKPTMCGVRIVIHVTAR
ncbi:hypothetical protein BDQ17DRAFT_1333202 [Cyathus striatus]|nr:hypothetical protein BDQ17DRAFT_1333202 [Cyathus striatus]